MPKLKRPEVRLAAVSGYPESRWYDRWKRYNIRKVPGKLPHEGFRVYRGGIRITGDYRLLGEARDFVRDYLTYVIVWSMHYPRDTFAGRTLEEALEAAQFDTRTRWFSTVTLASDPGEARISVALPYYIRPGTIVRPGVARLNRVFIHYEKG